MAITPPPFPAEDAIVDRRGRPTTPLIDYLTDRDTTSATATRGVAATTSLTAQEASIGTTALQAGSLVEGLYRISWYARITRAATTSSTLTVTIGWTESTLALTLGGAAITGNTTTTVQSGSIIAMLDGASPLTYATTYGSVGATTMQYRLDVIVERVTA
jgi:hypothetical protein